MRSLVVYVLIAGAAVICARPLYAFDFDQIELHGFVSQGYLKSSHNDYLAKTEEGSTEFNEAALNVSTCLTDKLRLGFQLLAHDLGDAGNDKVELDWGFGDYHWRDELGLRAGKVKRPMGLYNEGRDVDMLRTCILLPQSVYREYMRDITNAAKGAAVYGTLPLSALGSIDYQHVYGSKNIKYDTIALRKQITGLFPGVNPEEIQTTAKYMNTSHILWHTPLRGLKLCGGYETGKLLLDVPAQAATPTNAPGIFVPAKPAQKALVRIKGIKMASAEYHWKDFLLAVEYMDTVQTSSYNLADGRIMDITSHSLGYYGSVSYRFTPWLEAGMYHGVFYPNKKDKHGDDQAAYGRPEYMGWQKEVCLCLRFDPLSGWTLKGEAHHINGVAQVLDYEDVHDLHKDWSLYAAKITYSF